MADNVTYVNGDNATYVNSDSAIYHGPSGVVFFIPDPRWEEPNLLIPGKKPTGPVAIDRRHPLSRGLVGYCLDSQWLTGQRFTGSGLSVTASPKGTGVDADGTTNNRLSVDSHPGLVQDTSGWTWFCAFYKYGTAASFARLFGRTAKNAASQPYANYDFELNPSGSGQNQCRIGFCNSSTENSYVAVTNIGTGYNTLCGAGDASNVLGYSQGEYVGAAGIGMGDSSGSGDDDVYQGGYSPAGYQDTGSIVLVSAVWARKLSAEEIAILHRNPYQFLIPA